MNEDRARRTLYPRLEPRRAGRLAVSDLHELYWEECGHPDGIPVVGPSSTSEGVFHQFGFSAHGFQLGPGTGAMMAELVATGATNLPIDGLGIGRFER